MMNIVLLGNSHCLKKLIALFLTFSKSSTCKNYTMYRKINEMFFTFWAHQISLHFYFFQVTKRHQKYI